MGDPKPRVLSRLRRSQVRSGTQTEGHPDREWCSLNTIRAFSTGTWFRVVFILAYLALALLVGMSEDTRESIFPSWVPLPRYYGRTVMKDVILRKGVSMFFFIADYAHVKQNHRFYKKFPPATQVIEEFFWSCLGGSVESIFHAFLRQYLHKFNDNVFGLGVDPNDSWVWFFLRFIAVFLVIFIYSEAIEYFRHRMMHHPWLYKHFHSLHHFKNVTPLGGTAVHPVEAAFEAITNDIIFAFFHVPEWFIDVRDLVLAVFVSLVHVTHDIEVLGWIPGYEQMQFNHHIHHAKTHYNYSSGSPMWDKLFGTYYVPTDNKKFQEHYMDAPVVG